MSLVGSLEDLGLGDILQIVSLSRKSGALELRGEEGEGQIVFREGSIASAAVKGGASDLHELLRSSRQLAGPELEAAVQQARKDGRGLEELVVERGIASADELYALRRDHVENTVLGMFAWSSGEFSFEVCDQPAELAGDLDVSPGVNPQFLALEGTRVSDESQNRAEDEADAAAADGLNLDAAFGPDPVAEDAPIEVPEPPPEAPEAPVELEAVVEDVALEPEPAQPPSELPSAAIEPLPEPVAPLVEAEPVAVEVPAPEPMLAPAAEPIPAPASAPELTPEPIAAVAPAAPAEPAPVPPVVVVDPDLACLEWIKAGLEPLGCVVHIFQRTDHGVGRIRQYLARGQRPLVLLAADAPEDPLSGARDVAEMVERLKAQSERMPILLLADEGSAEAGSPAKGADGSVARPSRTQLADSRCVQERESLAKQLREQVQAQAEGLRAGSSTAPGRDLSQESLSRLKQVSDRLRTSAASGETLRMVMEFARETFSRVALFMVREGEVHGLAQLGLAAAGGPDDAGLRKLALPAREGAWFRAVLDGRKPVRRGPTDPGDQRLAVLLGNAVPEEAWVAPVVSGDCTVALLYGDNLPSRDLIGDTAALEVVLQQAGLVLDLACLERVLEQNEGK